ncbi:hypothetical protein B0H12DRAFT_1122046 [Mycena haematopus]|nr:hypothetical protein B0H12DRAFT_1122046 [Mycena haematopus]
MSRSERGGTVAKKSTGVPSTRTPIFYEVPSRSKSRSPSRGGSGSRSDPFTLCTTPATPTIKRKRSFNFSVGSSAAPSAVDRGQRIKPKPSNSQSHIVMSGPSSSVRPKKERERARASLTLHAPSSDSQGRRSLDKGKSKQVAEMGASSSRPTTPTYSGPLAAAEFERMRKELEALKETLKKTKHDDRKQIKKQNKTIEELRAQVAAESLARDEKDKLLAAASSKSRKSEELLQAIESSLQCQICIDLLSKPNLLAPCGHVFCLECLQQWFRSAPGNDSDDDMDPEDREQYILERDKSCPYCRARIVRRPVPVFVVKNVVTALRTSTTQPVAVQDEEADPWKGLFLPDDESSDTDEDFDQYGSSEESAAEFFDHYSEDLDDLDHVEVALALGLSGAFPEALTHLYASASESEDGSASGSDGEDEEVEDGEDVEEEDEDGDGDGDFDGTYSMPRWEPPRHVVEFENVSNSMWKMLRRGCTPRLIALFNMQYHHDEGLIAHVCSLDPSISEHHLGMGRNRLFLGWNIDVELTVVEGEAEKVYIVRQLRDIWQHPERWIVTERHGYPGRSIMDARRLTPMEEDAEMYDTSDSEAYSNEEEYS